MYDDVFKLQAYTSGDQLHIDRRTHLLTMRAATLLTSLSIIAPLISGLPSLESHSLNSDHSVIAPLTSGLPSPESHILNSDHSEQIPLIIWHGLGDTYDADGLKQIAELATSINPGTFVYPIRLSNDSSADRKAFVHLIIRHPLLHPSTNTPSAPSSAT